ncbi:Translation machinery-associated protein 22 [Blyttiomyces sp. JEL0837]|nr:Translation machinery-associated protein 22 [Blyttiomyces sp. JEL0837]
MADVEEVPVESAPSVPPTRVVTDILYCGVCTAPVEYCEFGPSAKRCRAWLKDKHPELYDRYWANVEEVAAKTENLEVDEGAEGSSASAQPAAPVKEKLDALQKEELKKEKKKKEAKVTIKRIERTKRKCVIAVAGLEVFDIDLKKAAKVFATKFATGSSVTKNPAGFDEIIVQGDVQDDIYDLILKTWKEIPEDNIEMS